MPPAHLGLDQALKLIGIGKLDEAKICLEELLESDPENTDLLYNLGMTYIELGEIGRASELLRRCIGLDPDYSNAYVAMGLGYYKEGDLKNAKDLFLQAVRVNPKNTFALKNLGALFRKEGNSARSFYYLKRAFALNPYDLRTVLGVALAYMDQMDTEKAEKHFQDIIEMNAPEDIQAIARDKLQELAAKEPSPLGLDLDAVLYLIDAIKIFKVETFLQAQETVSEITDLVRHRPNFNDSKARFTLRSIPGEFEYFQLICIMYACLRQFRPGMNIGIDLSDEYDLALNLAESEDLI
jgi:tetratricopeptide (TPR) repeat protein